ncbi:unnamed protein product [Cuscuta campestris]|uniref:Expansin-like EG45 domain-containing protein n=1 Tax=Cuscuta campestris TaxID=132261 RepID=A0A484LBP8_9ASTE|nr:unnamed protein product [Cuscuta campestris]
MNFLVVAVFCILAISCDCFNPKVFNISKPKSELTSAVWSAASATWYGDANGAGSDGGACGYTNSVEESPLYSRISAGASALFKKGEGCGACYQVKCVPSDNAACSGNPVTVVITDECPSGGVCATDSSHFDLSGTAFGGLALPGKADTLRNAGELKIQYQRFACAYPKGVELKFGVDSGSNPNYLAVLIEYVSGDGELSGVQLKQGGSGNSSSTWASMTRSWGAVWKYDCPAPGLVPPITLKLIDASGKYLIAPNVIPTGWKAGQTYRSATAAFVSP